MFHGAKSPCQATGGHARGLSSVAGRPPRTAEGRRSESGGWRWEPAQGRGRERVRPEGRGRMRASGSRQTGDRPPYGQRASASTDRPRQDPCAARSGGTTVFSGQAGQQAQRRGLVRDQRAGPVGVADLHEGHAAPSLVDLQDGLAVGPARRADVQDDLHRCAEHLAAGRSDDRPAHGQQDARPGQPVPPAARHQPAGQPGGAGAACTAGPPGPGTAGGASGRDSAAGCGRRSSSPRPWSVDQVRGSGERSAPGSPPTRVAWRIPHRGVCEPVPPCSSSSFSTAARRR